MFTKLIGGLVVVLGLAAGGIGWFVAGGSPEGCCHPGSECCFPGSPCCDVDCCSTGSTCCDPPQACCLSVFAKANENAECCQTVSRGRGCCQVVAKDDKVQVADKPTSGMTVIAVEDLDCPSCAKKIVAKMNEVAGVAKAEADVKTSKLTVAAKDGARPSPKAMWEAIETAGFKPTRLEGPGGTFTSKPKE